MDIDSVNRELQEGYQLTIADYVRRRADFVINVVQHTIDEFPGHLWLESAVEAEQFKALACFEFHNPIPLAPTKIRKPKVIVKNYPFRAEPAARDRWVKLNGGPPEVELISARFLIYPEMATSLLRMLRFLS